MTDKSDRPNDPGGRNILGLLDHGPFAPCSNAVPSATRDGAEGVAEEEIAKTILDMDCAPSPAAAAILRRFRVTPLVAAPPKPAPDAVRARIEAYRQRGGMLFSGFTVADDIEAALSAPVPSPDGALPAGVHFSIEMDNFYFSTGKGCGNEFFARWKPRWREFPQPKDAACSPSPAVAAEPVAVAWRYESHDGQIMFMQTRLSTEQFARGYYRDEDDDDFDENEGYGPFKWKNETPLYASPTVRGDREVPQVERIECVKMVDCLEVEAEPLWRLEIGGICADFETETGANNFRNAILSLPAQPATKMEVVGERAMDGLDAQADIWADEVRLVDQVKLIGRVARGLNDRMPADVRNGFIARLEAQVDAFLRQAYLEGFYRGGESRKEYDEAQAALTAALSNQVVVPSGWQLAPKEPVPEMIEAAEEFHANGVWYADGASLFGGLYKAMIGNCRMPATAYEGSRQERGDDKEPELR